MPDRVRRTIAMTTPPGDVDRVHDFLAQLWAEAASVSPLDRVGFETAIIELMANVIRHADPARAGVSCELTVTIDDDAMVAMVRDSGEPGTVTLEGNTMPADDSESGRGLALIEALVDEVAYERVDDHNRWTLRRRRSP